MKVDIREGKIIRASSFYFRAWPRGVNISITPIYKGKLLEKERIERTTFFNATYIENILPREYLVNVSKDDFYPWEKIISLSPGKVGGSKNITLVKRNPYFSLISEEVDFFKVSPSQREVIYSKNNNIYLFTPSNNYTKLVARPNFEIKDLFFFPHSPKIILKGEDYFLLNTDNLSLLPLDIEGEIINISNKGEIYFIENDILIKKDELGEKKTILKDFLSVSIYNDSIFYINEEGFLINHPEKKINKEPIEDFSTILMMGDNLAIKKEDSLYLLEKDEFNFIASPVTNVVTSNKEKFILSSENEIRIYFKEKQRDYPRREKGEVLFLSRFSKKIDNIFWWNNHYIIFSMGGEIRIMEIDNRNRLNSFVIKENVSDFFWSSINRKVFVLSEGNLYLSESLIF